MRDQYGWDGAAYDNWLFKQADDYMSRMSDECTYEDDCECNECQQDYMDYREARADAQYEERRLNNG